MCLFELLGSGVRSGDGAHERERDERILRHVESHRQGRIAFDQWWLPAPASESPFGHFSKRRRLKCGPAKHAQARARSRLLTFELDPVGQIKRCTRGSYSPLLFSQKFDD